MLTYQNLLFTLKCTDNHNKTGQIESYMLNQSCKWPVIAIKLEAHNSLEYHYILKLKDLYSWK